MNCTYTTSYQNVAFSPLRGSGQVYAPLLEREKKRKRERDGRERSILVSSLPVYPYIYVEQKAVKYPSGILGVYVHIIHYMEIIIN